MALEHAGLPADHAIVWPPAVHVVDVTARDGLQDTDTMITAEEKLHFVSLLLDAGVRHIEATSFMHPQWIPQLADADTVAAALPRRPNITYSALVPNQRGYERARAAGIDEVVLVVSASESHNRANLNRPVDVSLAQLADVAAAARQDGIFVRGAVATAFGCPFEGAVPPSAVLHVVEAYLAMGVQVVALADSIGVANPRQVHALFSAVRQLAPAEVSLGAHFHDRAGQALTNVFAALLAGATSFDGAIGGLGGCPYAPGAPGNLSTAALVALLESMGYATGIAAAGLDAAQEYVMMALRQGVPVTSGHSIRSATAHS